MTSRETITIETKMTAHEIVANWPAGDSTGVSHAHRADGAVSFYLTRMVAGASKALAESVFNGFVSVDRMVWTQGDDTTDRCRMMVYERTPDDQFDDAQKVLSVTSGPDNCQLAREVVREQCGIPVKTYHELLDHKPN